MIVELEAPPQDPIEQEEKEHVFEGKCTMKIISQSGDDRITWQKGFLDTVKEAREKFYELLEKGYKAYAVRKDGKRSNRQMFRFDPNVEEVIMVPMLAGG